MPELFHHITMFVLPYLECQLIQGNSNLVLDVINDISNHFRAIDNYAKDGGFYVTQRIMVKISLTTS